MRTFRICSSFECDPAAGMGLGLITRFGEYPTYTQHLPGRRYLDVQVTVLAWTLVLSFAWNRKPRTPAEKKFAFMLGKYENLATGDVFRNLKGGRP